ncbi:hypothetical protein [Kribbella speibonae]|uniref:Uncharacterized protein n=1 Tax=Kribbella speibonae TaxID=1572660 RepID=A0A4R0I9J8_9ACTN|nr:hypothetical protein [Kribbella speibonae]TCC29681.1 hypothetical protein E0H92_42485 [Kribbella speibonae]
MAHEYQRDDVWRTIGRADVDLATAISNCISGAGPLIADSVASVRASPCLMMFSDYGGAHNAARFEVISFMVTTPGGLTNFWTERQRLRRGQLGAARRMSYKTLNDKVRLRSLSGYLDAADHVTGLLITFAVDKRAAHRLSEDHHPEVAFGGLAPWSPRAFRKLTRIGHLAGIVVQGLRGDGQDLLWITDEDEIAPNPHKHSEATRLMAHLISSYCTGPLGHFRFGTTASDPGDLHIEDLAAVPDLAAGCLNQILSDMSPDPASRVVERLFIPSGGAVHPKLTQITTWLAANASALTKVNVVVDESADGCSVRRFTVVTDVREL